MIKKYFVSLQRYINTMNKTKCLLTTMGLACALGVQAQVEVRSEAQVTAASGEHAPLWLNANKYGLSSVDKSYGYLRVGAFRPIETDSARRWGVGFGADMALTYNMDTPVIPQQAFLEARWMKVHLTVGSKEEPMALKDQLLSSGSQTLGINARPVPSVRLSLPDYWAIPGLQGWLAIKGHVAYGLQTDDQWQRDFTHEQSRFTTHTRIHTKAGYMRIGKAERPFNVELGLEMGCQYGGRSYISQYGEMEMLKNNSGLEGAWHALIPSGYEANEVDDIYKNTDGNHLGSMVGRLNLDYPSWGISAYVDHFFEDHSQIFFYANNGYGEGDEWDTKVDNHYFVYDMRDAMWGLELRLKRCRWVSKIVAEYLYTKYQSGPIYHDHTPHIHDQISGRDNYYNHLVFTGWQHWGQVIGNPLYRSPAYNENSLIMVMDNRFWAFHGGVSGRPTDDLGYRLLMTWQRGFGTYDYPLPSPQTNVSLMAEVAYSPSRSKLLRGWSLKCAVGVDRGELLGDNIGLQLSVGRRIDVE